MMPTQSEKASTLERVDQRSLFRRQVKRLTLIVIALVIAMHLLAGVVASVFIVARYFAKPKANFTAAKVIDVKPEQREHKQAMDRVEALRPPPVLNNRIQSLKPTALMMPDLPTVPVDAMMPIVSAPLTTVPSTGAAGGIAGSHGSGSNGGFFGDAGLQGAGLLVGSFFDFKQTPDGKPTDMTPAQYQKEISKYIFNNWDDDRLARSFFKGPDKLHARQIYIPTIRAEEGPKAFHLEDKVQPRMWAAIYHATVVPPESGRMRFVGFGDDILVVRFNRKVVLDGSIFPPSGWKSKVPREPMDRLGNRNAVEGDWISLQKGEQDKIDIIIGEQPGVHFTAYLLCEYKDKPGVFSLFRLAGGSPPRQRSDKRIPPFDSKGVEWGVINKPTSMTNLPGLP